MVDRLVSGEEEKVQQELHAVAQRHPGQHGLPGQVVEERHQLLQDVDGGSAGDDGGVGQEER